MIHIALVMAAFIAAVYMLPAFLAAVARLAWYALLAAVVIGVIIAINHSNHPQPAPQAVQLYHN
jgi:hypothetical protein